MGETGGSGGGDSTGEGKEAGQYSEWGPWGVFWCDQNKDRKEGIVVRIPGSAYRFSGFKFKSPSCKGSYFKLVVEPLCGSSSSSVKWE